MQVKAERSNWRDEAISHRHRLWGFDCPAVDIDFLMIEYDKAVPVALIEYKHKFTGLQNYESANYKALTALAMFANIPFAVVIYDSDNWCFRARPINEQAKAYFTPFQVLSEQEYVATLYKIRNGRALPEHIATQLSSYNPTKD